VSISSDRSKKKFSTSPTPKPNVVPRDLTSPPATSKDLLINDRNAKYPEKITVATNPILKLDILKKNREKRRKTPDLLIGMSILY
jgi:hypothetical protein